MNQHSKGGRTCGGSAAALQFLSDKIRILIADDHEMIRRGLRYFIEQREEWRVCGEAQTGHEAVELASKLMPNVVVLDLTMPELNGLEAARRIKKSIPSAEVLIFSMHHSIDLVRQATEAGARGYVLKSDRTKHITNAIEALAEHTVYFTPLVSRVMLEAFLRQPALTTEPPLTSRERDVMQLVVEGHTNKSVADRLNIGLKTVETHRQTIMDKLRIHSLADLVRYAVRNQIIAP